jgi:Tfp pilus assembly protein PilN
VRPVNLLPARYRRARASGDRPGIGYFAIGALAVLLLMVLLLVVTNNGINDAKDKTAKAQAEQAAAQARVGQLQAYGDFASLKASREAAVRSVAQLRFDYERLMREIALVLPHNTYLTSMSASPGGGTASAGGTTATGPSVTIQGCAPNYPGVSDAIVRMRQLHNVVDVTLNSSTRNDTGTASNGTACKTQFNAQLSFNPETPAATQERVPARLGGGQ